MQDSSFPLPRPGHPDPTDDLESLFEVDTEIPLGQKLLKAGLLTQAQLAQALKEQRGTLLKFGEICLGHQWIRPEHLYQLTPSYSLCLGEVLLAQGLIEPDQLQIALRQQRRYGRKLGDILLSKGWITEQDLQAALQQQRRLKSSQSPNAWKTLHNFSEEEYSDQDEPQHYSISSEYPLDLSHLQNQEVEPIHDQEQDTESWPQDIESMQQSSMEVPNLATPPVFQDPEETIHAQPLSTQVSHYRSKAAALELQLDLQQREWESKAERLYFQAREYYQHILKLQAQQEQERQHYSQEIENLRNRYENRIRELEGSVHDHNSLTEMQRLKASLTAAMQKLQTADHVIQQQRYQLLTVKRQAQHLIQSIQIAPEGTDKREAHGDPTSVSSLDSTTI